MGINEISMRRSPQPSPAGMPFLSLLTVKVSVNGRLRRKTNLGLLARPRWVRWGIEGIHDQLAKIVARVVDVPPRAAAVGRWPAGGLRCTSFDLAAFAPS